MRKTRRQGRGQQRQPGFSDGSNAQIDSTHADPIRTGSLGIGATSKSRSFDDLVQLWTQGRDARRAGARHADRVTVDGVRVEEISRLRTRRCALRLPRAQMPRKTRWASHAGRSKSTATAPSGRCALAKCDPELFYLSRCLSRTRSLSPGGRLRRRGRCCPDTRRPGARAKRVPARARARRSCCPAPAWRFRLASCCSDSWPRRPKR